MKDMCTRKEASTSIQEVSRDDYPFTGNSNHCLLSSRITMLLSHRNKHQPRKAAKQHPSRVNPNCGSVMSCKRSQWAWRRWSVAAFISRRQYRSSLILQSVVDTELKVCLVLVRYCCCCCPRECGSTYNICCVFMSMP